MKCVTQKKGVSNKHKDSAKTCLRHLKLDLSSEFGKSRANFARELPDFQKIICKNFLFKSLTRTENLPKTCQHSNNTNIVLKYIRNIYIKSNNLTYSVVLKATSLCSKKMVYDVSIFQF